MSLLVRICIAILTSGLVVFGVYLVPRVWARRTGRSLPPQPQWPLSRCPQARLRLCHGGHVGLPIPGMYAAGLGTHPARVLLRALWALLPSECEHADVPWAAFRRPYRGRSHGRPSVSRISRCPPRSHGSCPGPGHLTSYFRPPMGSVLPLAAGVPALDTYRRAGPSSCETQGPWPMPCMRL